MIDINSRAVELSKKNALVNKLKVNAFTSDMYENVTKEYDYIISNPPIRVGNEILYKLLFDADKYLKNKGHLIIVINKDQGAKTVAKKLEEIYDVSILNKNKGFFVIDCQKR
jgi:16S rRNA (guanine1207-N2)-methyltransferase